MCREFCLVNSTIQRIWNNEPKLFVRLSRTDRE